MVAPKPTPSIDILTSDKAANDHSVALEAWGEAGWLAVGRICRWAVANGGKFDCPKP